MNQPFREPQVVDISGSSNKNAFHDALANTRKGDSIIYHTGEFAAGTHKRDAWEAYENDLVSLAQRRLEPRVFQFIAQRTGRRYKGAS
jgi:hypothetical protein